MSAYLLDDKEISAIINWGCDSDTTYFWNGSHIKLRQYPEETAQVLLDENYKSINYRYKEADKPHKINFERNHVSHIFNDGEIAKAVNCYEYQACETHEWHNSQAKTICRGIKDTIIRRLPGYEAGFWGIDHNKIKSLNKVISLSSLIKQGG